MKKLLLLLLIIGLNAENKVKDVIDCVTYKYTTEPENIELWDVCYNIAETTSLKLMHNLTGTIPPEIGNLVNLRELYLYNNQLTGEIPPEIGNLINLESLYLEKNGLTGTIPPEIGQLINLKWLHLSDNQLEGEIPPEIGNLTNLEYLGLSINQLSGTIPEEICNIIEDSWLYYNQLCPPYPSCISEYYIETWGQDTSNCP